MSNKGYVLILLLVVSSVTAGMLLMTVSAGKASLAEVEAQHIADHAAGAAAIIAARDLNFKAVTNRAMLANEVVIGQITGLVSWYEMARTTSQNISLITSWAPYVNSITIYLNRVLQQLRVPLTRGANAAIVFQQMILKSLQMSQWAFHQASWTTTLSTISEIIEQNDPDYELVLLNHQTLLDLDSIWLRFQQRRIPKHQKSYTEMVSESRDTFTAKRSYRWFDLLLASVEKAGGSEVSQKKGKIVWQSLDTIGLHTISLFGKHELPVGYGGSFIKQRISDLSSDHFGRSYRINRKSSHIASRNAFRFHTNHDVPRQYRLQENTGAPAITIAVKKLENEATVIKAVSRYQLHYSRPQRFWPHKSNELANLFNPLWEASRIYIPQWERDLILWQI